MATLQKIRNKAGLLVTIIGLALFAFIIGDFLNSGNTWFRQRQETVIEVNGTAVKIHDYDAKLQETIENYKNQSGGNIPDEYLGQIRQEVYERTVMEILLREESEKLGLAVTSDELFDMLQGENISPVVRNIPVFSDASGAFDKRKMLSFLQLIDNPVPTTASDEEKAQIEATKRQWPLLKKEIEDQRRAEKFGTLVSSAIVANSLEAKAQFEENKTSVDFDYVVQSYASVPDSSVVISQKEIQNLYDKKKELFKQKEGRIIKYIAVQIVPSKEDYNEIEEAINKLKPDFSESNKTLDVMNDNSDVPYVDAYLSASLLSTDIKAFAQNAQIGEIEGPKLIGNTYHMFRLMDKTTGPDSVKVNLLPLPNLQEASLKQYSDSIINLIKGGQTFSQVALQLTNSQSNGELGWVTENSAIGMLDAGFKNTLFSAPLSDLLVYKSTLGQSFLIQVTQRTANVIKYKVADLAMTVSPSTSTETILYNNLSHYVVENYTLDKFESAANEKGYICNSGFIVTANDNNIAGIKDTRKIVRWAFEHKKGEMSEIYECDVNYYVVAMLEGSQPEGYRSLESVSDLLKRELINDKKAEKIIADLKAKNFSSLQQYADALHTTIQSVKFVNFGTRMITGIGVEPALNAEVTVAEVNKVSNPIKGYNGVYVIQPTNKNIDNREFNLAEQKQIVESSGRYYIMGGLMEALKENATIKDNRIRFY